MTFSSRKKHYSDFTFSEVDFITKLFKTTDLENFKISSHFKDSANKRNISLQQIKNVWDSYEIIEFHRRFNYNRFLLRFNRPIKNRNLCIVIDFTSQEIITGYWNHKDDNHSTLDKNNYIHDLDVLNFFEKNKA